MYCTRFDKECVRRCYSYVFFVLTTTMDLERLFVVFKVRLLYSLFGPALDRVYVIIVVLCYAETKCVHFCEKIWWDLFFFLVFYYLASPSSIPPV